MELYIQKLKEIRKKEKLSISELAEKLKLNRNTLSAWENGKIIPSEIKVIALAKTLNVKVSEISNINDRIEKSEYNIVDTLPVTSYSENYTSTENKLYNDILKNVNRLNSDLMNSKIIIDALLTSTNSIIYIKDVEQKYIIANNSFLSNLSMHKHFNVIGKNDYDFFSKDEATKNIKEDGNILMSGHSVVNKEGYIPGSKRKKWGLIFKEPILDSENKILGILGKFVDITARKREEEYIKSIHICLDALHSTMFIYDMDKEKFTFISASFENLTGYPLSVIKKDNLFFINNSIYHEDRPYFIKCITRKSASKSKIIYRIQLPDNSIKTVQSELFRSKDILSRTITIITETIELLG